MPIGAGFAVDQQAFDFGPIEGHTGGGCQRLCGARKFRPGGGCRWRFPTGQLSQRGAEFGDPLACGRDNAADLRAAQPCREFIRVDRETA